MKSLALSDPKETKVMTVSKDLLDLWAQRVEMEKTVRLVQPGLKALLDLEVRRVRTETEVMLVKWDQQALKVKADLGENVVNKDTTVSKVYKGHLDSRALEVYKDQRETEAMAQRRNCLDGYCQWMLSWV